MSKLLLMVFATVVACSSAAGVEGVVVKGTLKTWDEIAKVALKVSGKSITDDAVKVASKTIEKASSVYGDDVATAAMRGGIEVAEQSIKRGPRFVRLMRNAGVYSDDAVIAIARSSGDAVKYAEKYGENVVKLCAKAPDAFSRCFPLVEKFAGKNAKSVVKVIATEIPTEQIPQVFGVIEKNPSVAGQFLECVVKGGKYFVDKVFEINSKQILTGGLSAAAIVTAYSLTAPARAEGGVITRQNETAMEIVGKGSPEDQSQFVTTVVSQNGDVRESWIQVALWPSIIVSSFVGLALIIFVIRKTKGGRRAKTGIVDAIKTSLPPDPTGKVVEGFQGDCKSGDWPDKKRMSYDNSDE